LYRLIQRKYHLGYRGLYSIGQILNDPSYYQNALFLSIYSNQSTKDFFLKISFLAQSSYKSFYTGGRFLTQCEVSFLEETNMNLLNPSLNLNDAVYVLMIKLFSLNSI
jgi:hypothetical protein